MTNKYNKLFTAKKKKNQTIPQFGSPVGDI